MSETTEKETNRQATDEAREKLLHAYMDYRLMNEEAPVNVYAFCKAAELEEENFYEHFGSFQALEEHIWKQLFEESISLAGDDEAFDEYNARERYLAFAFSLVSRLKKHLSFYRLSLWDIDLKMAHKHPARQGVKAARSFIDEILQYGISTQEIPERKMIMQLASKGVEGHLYSVLAFALKDDSAGLSRSDAYIEKSVNLLFDCLGNGIFDSMFDFVRFMAKEIKH